MGGGPLVPRDCLGFRSVELTKGWFCCQSENGDSSWLPITASKLEQALCHPIPVADAANDPRLKDPFLGFDELKAQWVGRRPWTYQFEFDSPPMNHISTAVLAFDGLDTFAEVYLDGRPVLTSSNMFVSHRVNVTEELRDKGHHELRIIFDSAVLKAAEIKKACPEHKWLCWNGDSARLAVRKAQYHWGWDWGPELCCAGVWKPLRLEVFAARIDDLMIQTALAPDFTSAAIQIRVKIESKHLKGLRVSFEISLQEQIVSECSSYVLPDGHASASLSIRGPSLWMPAGYGLQRLYNVRVTLSSSDTQLHSESRKIGLRTVELIQQPDHLGRSFFFRINDVDIFCGGSCWVPADSFLPNVTQERYRAWLELLISGNQNMIRVWGGGIYEQDCFYDICDELGILVWQDFPFACGNYPCSSTVLDSIQQEATLNLRRLRHHVSLTLLAGNNEDYQVAQSAGLTYDSSDKDPTNWLRTDFPARYIYEKLLPDIVRQECPDIPYRPSSPWGDGRPTSSPGGGDMHQWNVWHGTQEMYQRYPELGGRFVSEFGMEALPHFQTVKAFLGPDVESDEKPLHPQGELVNFHNKADGHERRLAIYLAENVRTDVETLRGYIHLTQLIQCEAVTSAYRGWRRQWGMAGSRKCGGALVWQLNDCWPVISWSLVDYYLRPKAAYHGIKRCLAPIAVAIRREHWDWSLGHAREPKSLRWEAWCVSSRFEDLVVDVEISFWQVKDGKAVKEPTFVRGLSLSANSTTPVAQGLIDNEHEPYHVLAVRVYHHGSIVARDMDWPQPLKYLRFPDRNVAVKTKGHELRVNAERPVKCCVFEERDGCTFSDNALDLAPGDEQVINVTGLKDGDPPFRASYLGDEEQ